MLGKENIRAIFEQVLAISPADQTEVLFLGEDSGLTRFANSYIHQNVAQNDAELRVRVVFGKKIGVASTNDLSVESIKRVVESAITIAKLQRENPDFVSLPAPAPVSQVTGYAPGTASFTPESRAKAVGLVCRKAVENKLIASGAFYTGTSELAVANSLGVFAYHPSTVAELNTVIMSDSSAGYADAVSLDAQEIDPEAVAVEAVDKALRSRNPTGLEPGEYEVILEEYAVFDILEFLAYLGFSALAVQEGHSFMKLGQKVVGENISIWDDGLSPGGLPLPFDCEGVPRQKVPLIDKGFAVGLVYDSYTAGKEGKASTGHALPAPNTYGPIPMNLWMGTGQSDKEEMLKSTKRGIWVTRFHYTRPIHPLKVIVTGMTRDGTFLVESGEIAGPIKNLRFTQSYLEALSSVELMGAQTKLERGLMGGSRVPALKVSRFNFSGVTEF